MDGHSFFGHAFFLGESDDEIVVIHSAVGSTEHLFTVEQSGGEHLFTILPNGEVDINHTATENGEVALDIRVDASGFADVVGLEIDYITRALQAEDEEELIICAIDQSDAQGGEVVCLVVLPTEGAADIVALEAGILVNPIRQLSGDFVDMNSAFVAGVDRLAEFIDPDLNIPMFVNDDDNVLIGDTQRFEEIEFLLATVASGAGAKLQFEHSTGVGTFETFNPADTTRGMRQTGIIAWDLELITDDWVVGANDEFLIRITRTANNLNTVPIEQKVQIGIATEYFWDKNGSILIRDITVSDFNGTGTDINVSQIQAGFFFGDGAGLTNLPAGDVTRIFEGGNIDVNSNDGDVLVSFDDGNFTGFANSWTANQLLSSNNELQFRDTTISINSPSANRMVLEASDFVSITRDGKIRFLTLSDGVQIGSGSSDPSVDLRLVFNAETNNGEFKWMEDEDYFSFSDDIFLATTEKLFLRDTEIFLNSSTDGQLDIDADVEIELNAPTIDLIGTVNATTAIITDANVTNDLNALANIRILDGNLYITEDFGICLNQACTKFITYNGDAIVIQS